MIKLFLATLVSLSLISCEKGTSSNIDLNKIVNKEWYWGGRSTPQIMSIRFNTNDTMLMTQCVWIVPPYQYNTSKHKYFTFSDDSLNVAANNFRIHTLNDSVLITDSWMAPGNPALRDTFTTY